MYIRSCFNALLPLYILTSTYYMTKLYTKSAYVYLYRYSLKMAKDNARKYVGVSSILNMRHLFVTQLFFVHNAWNVYNINGTHHSVQFIALAAEWVTSQAPEMRAQWLNQMRRSACSTYINGGQSYHASCVTDLHRHKNNLRLESTTAMAAAKFVVSISSTHTHTWLVSCV